MVFYVPNLVSRFCTLCTMYVILHSLILSPVPATSAQCRGGGGYCGCGDYFGGSGPGCGIGCGCGSCGCGFCAGCRGCRDCRGRIGCVYGFGSACHATNSGIGCGCSGGVYAGPSGSAAVGHVTKPTAPRFGNHSSVDLPVLISFHPRPFAHRHPPSPLSALFPPPPCGEPLI